MAATYSDIIQKRGGKAAYSIENERGTQWQSFIANDCFNEVLGVVLQAVRGNDIDAHKSFWLQGTYGTGKSHAVAVITHLLCDPVEDIKTWVDYEYRDPKYAALREKIYSLRKLKRLLPVKVEGLCNMSHVADLPLVLQTAVVRALNENDIDMVVDTDFDELIAHVKANAVIWDDLIRRVAELRSIAPTREKLIQKLAIKDMATFQKAKMAQREAKLHFVLSQDSAAQWLIEVQDRLRAETGYQGLLILWDEFTDVMNEAIGVPVLKALQTIAQKFANEDSDSFLFLISHPSALNNLTSEETKQTDGRYHRKHYNMETVGAYKIMSRKFQILNEDMHTWLRDRFYAQHPQLLDIYVQRSADPLTTRADLLNLFPLHPATAFLATHYATVAGSSSRSVFEFIGQNEALDAFMASPQEFANGHTITADYLWDFVQGVFRDDVTNYGAVMERFNTYRQHVSQRGPEHFAIFKGVLLLNALNNISAKTDNSLTAPTEENIRTLFAGTQYADALAEALEWFNSEGVIQRMPGGIYSVQFSALPSQEIEEKKSRLMEGDYASISRVLSFADTGRTKILKEYVQRVIHPLEIGLYSQAANDSALRESIKRAKRATRPSVLYLAILFGKTSAEVGHLRDLAQQWADSVDDPELRDIVFMVVDTPFEDQNYARFIEYIANYEVANSHGFLDQVKVHRKHAEDLIKEWLAAAWRGNATIMVNGHTHPLNLKHLSRELNDAIAPLVFPLGPDALDVLRHKSPSTFWKPQVSKEIIRAFIFHTTKDELSNLAGPMRPAQHLIHDALDDNLDWKADCPPSHPMRAVYDYIQKRIKHADKSVLFNFADKLADLQRPPYGLSGNYASAAMIAFALRQWAGKIYDAVGKPVDANGLVAIVADLVSVWVKDKTSAKLSYKFQTPEADKVLKALVPALRLNKLKGYNDISSLTDLRFAISGPFAEENGYPLWALKYMDEEFCKSHPAILLNDDIRLLIDKITELCTNERNDVNLNKAILPLAERYRADIPDIISKEGSFRRGFENYLMDQPNVALRREEIDEALDYLHKHLQSTIGYWTEAQVADALKDWRLKRNMQPQSAPGGAAPAPAPAASAAAGEPAQTYVTAEAVQRVKEEAKAEAQRELKGDSAKVMDKAQRAKAKIGSIVSNYELREVLNGVVDLNYEFVIDEILKLIDSAK